jgi:hypothetical protein
VTFTFLILLCKLKLAQGGVRFRNSHGAPTILSAGVNGRMHMCSPRGLGSAKKSRAQGISSDPWMGLRLGVRTHVTLKAKGDLESARPGDVQLVRCSM